MTYTIGVPFDAQSLANSKPQIRANFQVIFNDFAVNHVAFNSLGEGKHKFLQMPNQGADATTLASESAFYAKSAQAYSNLFWRQESGGADPTKNQGAVIQMTNILPINALNGSTFLPGGLLLNFGQVVLAGGIATVLYPTGYEFSLGGVANPAWSIQLTVFASTTTVPRTATVKSSSSDETGFDITTFGLTNQTIFWMALGPKT